LSYSQHFSTTHLEINYNKPFQASDNIIIAPSRFTENFETNGAVIKLDDGYTFGLGDHPTTRMILQGIDYILSANLTKSESQMKNALDVGTGTGVLAIAAAALGVDQVSAIDIDATACTEAQKNCCLNGFEHRIRVSQKSIDQFPDHRFDLLMVNLRPPTIRQLIQKMLAVSSRQATWIISGCRVAERVRLEKFLPQEISEVVWEQEQHDWSAFAVKRK
jgi:ribosomal protein L11 methyltransferase